MITIQKRISLFIAISLLFATGCNHKPCKIEERANSTMTGNEKPSSSSKDLSNRVFVYKPDGSLQCGQGQKIEINEMKKQLGSIEVYSSDNKHDGLMRVQICGQPTGSCNIYEIATSDLDQAIKLGFKKWIRN